MTRQCAWCGADLGTTAGPADAISHGICPACLAQIGAQDGPVAVVRVPIAVPYVPPSDLRLELRARVTDWLARHGIHRGGGEA